MVRHWQFSSALCLAFVSVCTHCKPSARDVHFSDTEGREFKSVCDGEHGCRHSRISGHAVHADYPDVVVEASGRLVGVCDVGASKAVEPGNCRAIVCQADQDCPPLGGLPTGHCLNRLCIAPENPMNSSDAVLLCLAGTGLGREAPKQVERFAMALNCGNPCTIPAPCRQP